MFVFIGLFVVILFICLYLAVRKYVPTLLRKQPESESFLANQPIPNPAEETAQNLPPEGPLHARDMKDGSVELSWHPPANDKGRRLTGYLVETQISEETDWVRIDETISRDVLQFNAGSLQADKIYKFRIFARYGAGISEPLETNEPIRIKIARKMNLVGQMETKDRKSREVCGLTWLPVTVYVLCIEPVKIFAFSGVKPFDRVEDREIEIDEMEYPYDMTSIANPASLIISDYSENQCLWVISIENRSLTSWKVDGRPRRLSTTSKDNILVIVEKELARKTRRYYLDVFDESSLLDRSCSSRIPLDESILDPFNVVETSEGNFILIYKSKLSQQGVQIIEMTSRGDTVRKKDLISCNFLPKCLAIAENNKIFIADHSGDCVYLLDQFWSADLETVLNRDQRIDGPTRLCYLPNKQLLIVGQLRNPFVSIFSSANVGVKRKSVRSMWKSLLRF